MRTYHGLIVHRAQSAAESHHRRGLRHFRSRRIVFYCGEFAFDIVKKSQEPTSYFPFLDASKACQRVIFPQRHGYL